MANKVMPVAIAYIFPGDSPMTIILIAILKKTDLGERMEKNSCTKFKLGDEQYRRLIWAETSNYVSMSPDPGAHDYSKRVT